MINKTTNYNLSKPTEDEFYDVNVTNGNMDIIDSELKKNEDSIKTVNEQLGEMTQVPTTNKNVSGAITELFTDVSDGKSLIGGAITDVDDSVVIPTEPTFQNLADAIGQISTGKKYFSVEINNDGGTGGVVCGQRTYECGFRAKIIVMEVLHANYGGLTAQIYAEIGTSNVLRSGTVNVGITKISDNYSTAGSGCYVNSVGETNFTILVGNNSEYYWNNVYSTALRITAIEL